jgi:hypothetical protein
MHPKLLRLLNIDDGINEIVVIKNGKVIHSFKTMELFVKNNPIKFVKEFSDDEHEEDQDQDQDNGSDHSDKVDYNKKCEQLTELIEAFKSHSLDDAPPAPAPASEPVPASETNEDPESEKNDESLETSETDETDETIETDKTSDDIPDDYILDPTAYDFIIRNFYYEDEKTGEIHSFVFKYDIFYKSEIVEKYDIEMIKDKYFSTRKFIGISLKTNNQKYNINLTSPSNYYLSDNSILNYSFMKWYMMKHHNVKLSREYLISCIDNHVEMYRIHPGKKIIVYKNNFQLVDDETFNSDSDTDTDTDNDKRTHSDANVESDTDTDTDTNTNNDTETDTDTCTGNSNDNNETENQNEKIKEPRVLFINNLEESHEMCDIEILDYD